MVTFALHFIALITFSSAFNFIGCCSGDAEKARTEKARTENAAPKYRGGNGEALSPWGR